MTPKNASNTMLELKQDIQLNITIKLSTHMRGMDIVFLSQMTKFRTSKYKPSLIRNPNCCCVIKLVIYLRTATENN